MSKLKNTISELNKHKDPKKAKVLSRFFKTGKGEYGEGDIFLGLTVPIQRNIAKKYFDMSLKETEKLMQSKIHEYRLTAILILVQKYQKAKKEKERKEIVNLYLKNTKYVNNWDLVDLSCHKIIGNFILDKDRALLYKLAKSKILWERRIAVISSFAFIQENQFEDSLKLAKILLNDKHDLIHKAVGWMLREIGKKNQKLEEQFLKKYYQKMPRTMLRYAIEKFSESKRKFYLKKSKV